MRSLIAQERATRDSVARSQISVAVMQGEIAGGQVDIDLNQIWDIDIGNSGSNLDSRFRNWDANCGSAEQLQMRGATAQLSEEWESACQATLAERAKFTPIYKRIIEQRAELKSFQSSAMVRTEVTGRSRPGAKLVNTPPWKRLSETPAAIQRVPA